MTLNIQPAVMSRQFLPPRLACMTEVGATDADKVRGHTRLRTLMEIRLDNAHQTLIYARS